MILKGVRGVSVNYGDSVANLDPRFGQITPIQPTNNSAATKVVSELILKGKQQVLIGGIEKVR